MPPTDDATWMHLREQLLQAITALADGEAVLVDLPELARPMPPRGGMLGRLLGAAPVMLAPWVRLQRQDDHLRGEALRGAAARGQFPMSREERDLIVGQGWHETRIEESGNFAKWWPDDVTAEAYLPAPDAQAAAEATLRLLRDTYGALPEQVRIA